MTKYQRKLENIDIDKIAVGKYQVRVADFEGDDFEELKCNIGVNGLLQPIGITQSEGGEYEYECLFGQRRLSAYRELAKGDSSFKKIPAYDFEGPLSIEDGKSISLAENTGQKSMTSAELTDAFTDLYERFGTYVEVERQSGFPRSLIQKHVKFARLPKELKDAVRDTGLHMPVAIKIADAATTPGGYDMEKIKTLQAALPELDDDARNRLLRRAKESPRVAVKDLVKKIDDPDPTQRVTVTLDRPVYENVTDLAETRDESVNDSLVNLIEDGLTREGY